MVELSLAPAAVGLQPVAEALQRGGVVEPGLPGRPSVSGRQEGVDVVDVDRAPQVGGERERLSGLCQVHGLTHPAGELVGVDRLLTRHVEHRHHPDERVLEQGRDGRDADRTVALDPGDAGALRERQVGQVHVERGGRPEVVGVEARRRGHRR